MLTAWAISEAIKQAEQLRQHYRRDPELVEVLTAYITMLQYMRELLKANGI